MKKLRLIAIFGITTSILFIACTKDKNDNEVKVSPEELLATITEKAWDLESFKENGIEKVVELKSDSCYQSIVFVNDDNQMFYGYNNWIGCFINGTWFFYDNGTRLEIDFVHTPYPTFGPWGSGAFAIWNVIQLKTDRLQIQVDYDNKNYEAILKPL